MRTRRNAAALRDAELACESRNLLSLPHKQQNIACALVARHALVNARTSDKRTYQSHSLAPLPLAPLFVSTLWRYVDVYVRARRKREDFTLLSEPNLCISICSRSSISASAQLTLRSFCSGNAYAAPRRSASRRAASRPRHT